MSTFTIKIGQPSSDVKSAYLWYMHFKSPSADYIDYLQNKLIEALKRKLEEGNLTFEEFANNLQQKGGTIDKARCRTVSIRIYEVLFECSQDGDIIITLDNDRIDLPLKTNSYACDRFPIIALLYQHCKNISSLAKELIELQDYIKTEQFHKDEEFYLAVTNYILDDFNRNIKIELPISYDVTYFIGIEFEGDKQFVLSYEGSVSPSLSREDWKSQVDEYLKHIASRHILCYKEEKKELEKVLLLFQDNIESINSYRYLVFRRIWSPKEVIRLYNGLDDLNKSYNNALEEWKQDLFRSYLKSTKNIVPAAEFYFNRQDELIIDTSTDGSQIILHIKQECFSASYDISLGKFSMTLVPAVQEVLNFEQPHRELVAKDSNSSISFRNLYQLNNTLKKLTQIKKRYNKLYRFAQTGVFQEAINQVYEDMAPYVIADKTCRFFYSLDLSIQYPTVLVVGISNPIKYHNHVFTFDVKDSNFKKEWNKFFEEWKAYEIKNAQEKIASYQNAINSFLQYLKIQKE